MAQLLEKNGAEMCSALVNIAAPIKSFVEDQEFIETFRECTKKGMTNKLQGIMTIYADMVPLLFGDNHLKDTLTILAIVEGKSARELMKMSGVEMIKDALAAWKEQLAPFFTQLGVSVTEQ